MVNPFYARLPLESIGKLRAGDGVCVAEHRLKHWASAFKAPRATRYRGDGPSRLVGVAMMAFRVDNGLTNAYELLTRFVGRYSIPAPATIAPRLQKLRNAQGSTTSNRHSSAASRGPLTSSGGAVSKIYSSTGNQ